MPKRWINDGQSGGHWQYLDFDAEWDTSSKCNHRSVATVYDLPSVFHRLDEIQKLILDGEFEGL